MIIITLIEITKIVMNRKMRKAMIQSSIETKMMAKIEIFAIKMIITQEMVPVETITIEMKKMNSSNLIGLETKITKVKIEIFKIIIKRSNSRHQEGTEEMNLQTKKKKNNLKIIQIKIRKIYSNSHSRMENKRRKMKVK